MQQNASIDQHYSILSYGCQMNERDSERLAGQLRQIGYREADSIEQSDVIVINTCCVRESAENKIYGKIGELKKLKKQNPELIIAVCGCMAQKDQDQVLRKAPHVDLVFGTHNIHRLPELIAEVRSGHQSLTEFLPDVEGELAELPSLRESTVCAYVTIMYGCNNFCTYCIVPYVRGREKSRPLDAIVAEIHDLVQNGCREVTLLGQNVNSYGKDLDGGIDFADLLWTVNDIPGLRRIRFMTSHPKDLSERVVDAMSNCEKVCPHLHLPVQSGSNSLLAKMNRGYTTDYYRRVVYQVRQAIPGIALTTDLIVGFPGETDQLFDETLQFVQEIGFDSAYTFLYSRRSGTPAATMTEQIPQSVKKQRLQRLAELQNHISLDINSQLTDTVQQVLVEGPSKHNASVWTGRTPTNKIVLWEASNPEPGTLQDVYIDQAQTWVLKGRPIMSANNGDE